MPEITVQPSGKCYAYTPGESLLEILLAAKVFVENPCNGKGVCGKCRVKIIKGTLSEPCATEQELLKEKELAQGIRLSCMVRPKADLEIQLLGREKKHEVLASGYVPEFAFDCGIHKHVVEIQKPALHDQTPLEDQIKNQLKEQTGGEILAKSLRLETLQSVSFQPGPVTVVRRGNHVLHIEKGDTTDILYGIAIDIGTTTVVCVLVDMLTGEELAHASMINAQKHFGLDVLTRITYEMEHPQDGIKNLQDAMVKSINDMIGDICVQAGVLREHIYEITVGANCTMMHMLLGVDAVPIGKAPYAPMFVRAKDLPAAWAGIHAAPGARLYCLPSVSAYIGADIVAGAYVCQLRKEKGNVLFIDIGTNGEIVLAHQGRLLCCSCAAGPALEGMNISSGMRAAEGAVEDVKITPQGVQLKVIGEEPAAGICGSGILAAVKELLKTGMISKSGVFIKKEKLDETDYRYPMIGTDGARREFILASHPEKIQITQQDVRQVQLAKGAILSGFLALLNEAGIGMEELDKVLIAGQFGAHLPVDSMTGIGILPREVADKIVYVGNTSKTGAYMALMSGKVKREMEELAHYMDYMELGATKGYERLFADCLIFPDFSDVQGEGEE